MRVHAIVGPTDARLSATRAYDVIAAEYDEYVRGDYWMRQKLHAHYRRVFTPGARVLDVGCGTGIDALFLAGLGVQVMGIDGSPAMIEQFRAKLHSFRDVGARVLRVEDLNELDDERFDGVFSAFAGLNSVEDLRGFAVDAARLLRPGGRMVLHMLNRFSLWEWLGAAWRRDLARARTVGRLSNREFVIGGESVPHRVYSPREAYATYFEAAFILREMYGLGALRPPHTVRRIPPPLVRALEALDTRLGGAPLLRDAGRFFVLDLERRSA